MNHGAQTQGTDSSRGLRHARLRGAPHCPRAALQNACHPRQLLFSTHPCPGLVDENRASETDSQNPTFQDTPSHPTS